MIKRRFILLILLTIWILCSMSLVSLLLYFDPYLHKNLALSLMTVCFLGAVSSIVSLWIYFVKKIYYRGEVGMYHIMTSLRQSFFFAFFCLGSIVVLSLGIPSVLPIVLLFLSVIFLELFIQSF
jgi:hypothetical protein